MLVMTVPFFKVVVLAIGILETVIEDERHFPDKDSAVDFIKSLRPGLVGVLVEV